MNLPLQNRAGYNQGPQPSWSLTRSRFIGQPAVKATGRDTVIFRNSPQVPGESNPRSWGAWHTFITGLIYNLTGGEIGVDLILIDDQDNEFNLTIGSFGPVPADTNAPIYGPLEALEGYRGGVLAIPPGWRIILRVTSGNPTAGRGIVIWPWIHDTSRNIVPVVAPLSTQMSEFGPPKGRAWQLVGNKGSEGALESCLGYFNFDSVIRNVSEEWMHLAGEDIQVSSGIAVTPRVDTESGISPGFFVVEEATQKGFILAYPDKIKVKAGENDTSAPLYMFATFAEFDLPRDMG